MTQRLRIVVCDYLVRGPVGGMAWSTVHYLRGLLALGHEVYYVEDGGDYPACYDPSRHEISTDPTYGLSFAQRVLRSVGMDHVWAYFDADKHEWLGPLAGDAKIVFGQADILLNLGGSNQLRPWMLMTPVRILIDKDPAFTQIRHLLDEGRMANARLHTHYFTFGENYGRPACEIPDDGFPWLTTRHPIALEAWPLASPRPAGNFTTVMLWESYAEATLAGRRYGMKAESFTPILKLPRQINAQLELAVGGETTPRERLRKHGWRLVDPLQVSRDLDTYQHYICNSKAEFSVAKEGYVSSHSGWFSERSASYLATGRPVVMQDTGFSDWMQTGHGVLAFNDLNEAVRAIEAINAHYESHCRAARSLVESLFEARMVLAKLIAQL